MVKVRLDEMKKAGEFVGKFGTQYHFFGNSDYQTHFYVNKFLLFYLHLKKLQARHHGHNAHENRITSYNVCYTKLLRLWAAIWADIP